jgi:membrane protein YqaA with SNARE-associated domain
MEATARAVATSDTFKKTLTGIGVLFIILSFFIAIQPDTFLTFGYIGIFLYNAINSGLLILPVLTQKLPLIPVVLASALGNIPNTSINYFVGNSSTRLFSGNKYITWLKNVMKKFGLFAVFILAIVPLPLDVNGLMSGYLGIPFKKYILVNLLGKLIIFTLVGIGLLTVTASLKH